MSKKNTQSVFLRAFLQVVIVAVCMVIVAFISYHAVFWYFKNGHDKTAKSTEKVEDGIVSTAILFHNEQKESMDGIMLKMLQTDTNNVDMIVIPTNTELLAGSEVYSQLKEKSDLLPEPMTIGQIPTYISNAEESYELTVAALEELLGIDKIAYYETYNEEALKSLVNLLPEQTIEVPMVMTQTNEEEEQVTLEQGSQSLDGEKVNMLLTFTGYSQGAIDQAKMTAQFFNQYYKTALGLDETGKKEFYKQYYEIVSSNLGEKVITEYEHNFIATTPVQFRVHLLEGTQDGQLYEVQSEQVESFIKEIEETKEAYTEEQDLSNLVVAPVTSSKDLAIKVYNGTRVEGLATEWVHRLSADGYQIVGAANENDQEKQHAIIYVKTEGMGLDLRAYFPDAQYITDPSLSGIDIKIVLGMEQARS